MPCRMSRRPPSSWRCRGCSWAIQSISGFRGCLRKRRYAIAISDKHSYFLPEADHAFNSTNTQPYLNTPFLVSLARCLQLQRRQEAEEGRRASVSKLRTRDRSSQARSCAPLARSLGRPPRSVEEAVTCFSAQTRVRARTHVLRTLGTSRTQQFS